MKKDWRDIFQSLRIALDIRKLFFGFAILASFGIAISLFSGFMMYQVVDDYNEMKGEDKSGKVPTYEEFINDPGFSNRSFFQLLSEGDGFAIRNAYLLTLEDLGFKQYRVEKNSLLNPGEETKVRRFPDHVAKGLTFWRSLVLIVLSLIMWFFVSRWGGAITRSAMIEFAKDERIEMGEALDFAKKNAKPIFWAPISLLLFFIFLFLAVALWGLIGQVPVIGQIIDILTFPLVLIAGFLMAILVFGGFFALGLYLPAVAAEETDSFDALSRSFSYFFGSPFRTLWYNFIQLIFGVVCVAFIWFITGLIFYLISWAAGYGMGENWALFKAFITLGQYQGESIGLSEIADKAGFFPAIFSFFMGLFAVMITGLALAYTVSYKMSSYAIIYLLLRNKVDGTDMTDISYEEIDFIKAMENSAKTEETADKAETEKKNDEPEKEKAEEKSDKADESEGEEK